MNLSVMCIAHLLLILTSSLAIGVQASNQEWFLMTIDGLQEGIIGYPGLSYEASRYEPLCGTFGTSSSYNLEWNYPGNDYTGGGTTADCSFAMDEYSNNTDTLAIYDIYGTRLENARVGGGLETCLCFSLKRADGVMSDFCYWFNVDGRTYVEWTTYDNTPQQYVLISTYRPNSEKALPMCDEVNVSSLEAQWSATAYQPSVYEPVSTLNNGNPTTATVHSVKTVYVQTTSTPSIVSYTASSTFVSLLPDGNTTTIVTGIATEAPVVTNTATTTAPAPSMTSVTHGYSESDKIALGVGIGIGIPMFILSLFACMRAYRTI